MSIFIVLAVILLLLVPFLVFYRRVAKRGPLVRSLNMSLFLVTLPRSDSEEEGGHKDHKDKIAVMEQLLSSFSTLRARGLKGLLYGQPYIALEMAVHHKGEEIHTYIAVPRSIEHVLEKQVYGFFPFADVHKVDDYNIFHPSGASVGSYLALSNSSVLPLLTYQNLSTDPLNAIATAMSKIAEEGEGVALQCIMRPADARAQRELAQKVIREMQKGYDFHTSLRKAKANSGVRELMGATKNESGATELPKGAPDEQAIKLIQEKVAKQHFLTNLRLIVSADTEGRAEQILADLEASFAQFNNPSGNSFKPRAVSKRNMKQFIFQYSFRIPKPRIALPLSSEEIASFFHFPTSSAGIPKLKSLKHKSVEPPVNLPTEGVILGENVYRGNKTPVRITKNDRRRHMYIIGQTGTGKTTFMKNLIKQDIKNGEGVAVIDPHGDLVHDILENTPPERRGDIVWFDPGDASRPFGLNLLEFDPQRPEQKTLVVNELLAIFNKLFASETMGPMFDQYFRNSALLLLNDYGHEIPTLLDIPRVLTDRDYRRDKLNRETNPVVKEFWEKEAEKAGGEAKLENITPYVTSKINGFVADEFLRPIIGQKTSSLNFRDAMDNKRIILVNLSKGKLGEMNADLVGLVIVSKLLVAALSRVDSPEEQRNDFFLYMDEFQSFTTDSIATILSEARKYRLNLVIAHQFIQQLESNIRNAVFGNVGSTIAFRVGADDAEYLENQFRPTFSKSDLMNIDNFNAHVKLLINGKTSKPFSMEILPS